MKITVMGVLVVIAGLLVLSLIMYAVQQGNDETGQNNNEQPVKPS